LAFDLVLPIWWDYSFTASTKPYHHYLAADFDEDTPQFPQVITPYTSLIFNISERRDPPTYDNYKVLLYLVPDMGRTITWSGSESSYWEASMRIEPCGAPALISPHHKINISLEQGTRSKQVYIERFISLVLEDTLIPELPYSTYIVGDGLKIYRTVNMTKLEGYLVISLTSTIPTIDVSTVIPEVILATGNQCIEFYNPKSKYRIAKIVPTGVYSYNITVPAQEIWYIGFVTTGQALEIKVDFMVVNNLPINTLPDIILPDTPDIGLNDNITITCDFGLTSWITGISGIVIIIVIIILLCNISTICECCLVSKKEVPVDNLIYY
jgi:hypothetical protein